MPFDKDKDCAGCKKPAKTDAVLCNICNLWYDIKCSGCDSETSKFLMSTAGKSSSVSWSCTSCDSSIKKLHNMIGAVNSRVEQVENKIDDIKVVLDSLDQKIQKRVGDVSQEMATAVTDIKNDVRIAVESLNKKIDMLSSISDGETGPKTGGPQGVRHGQIMTPNFLSLVATELKERGNRAQNAVFTGDAITEEKVNLIVDKVGVDLPTKLVQVGKPERKFFIATFKSEGDKWRVIAKTRGICMSSDTLTHIYVNPDLTKSERDQQYLLRQEKRERNSRGEEVVIRKGRVVPRSV